MKSNKTVFNSPKGMVYTPISGIRGRFKIILLSNQIWLLILAVISLVSILTK